MPKRMPVVVNGQAVERDPEQDQLDVEDLETLLRKVVLSDEEVRSLEEDYRRAQLDARRAKRHLREAMMRRTIANNAARRALDRRAGS